MKSFYTKIENSKTGLKIPFIQEHSLCSKYDPEKEAKIFAEQFSKETRFFVIVGLAGGYHIKKLLNDNKNRKIIVIENLNEDFDFLCEIDCCKELSKDKRVVFSTPEKLFRTIIDNYLPSFYGSLNFAILRSWENIFPKNCDFIKQIIKQALDAVQADFSVQSHFGKIWQKNIMENLQLSPSVNNFEKNLSFIKEQKTRNALIVAAGPSLDENIKSLKNKKDFYCIISTDTALPVLLKNSIIPQAVVTIDAQMISHCHFLEDLGNCQDTVFFCDLCSNSAIAKKLLKLHKKIVFFSSGHPLSAFASNFCGNNFIKLNSGSGTVTIACADLAFTCGFLEVEFFGADFSYLNGKPYARGTYLDILYQKNQNRIFNCETKFVELMFRGKLKKIKQGVYTNSVLESYKASLDFFIASKKNEFLGNLTNFDFLSFKKEFKKQLLLLPADFIDSLDNPYFLTLLPLMAFYEKKHSITESYKLARNTALRYT
ncbi:motility associated factor glycosyltransferase family protein [Treponema pectinovorum]|uniref:motility associated factor glycosyltransferase family protein n=1 Tax=Treponema pectinovorum TaxID=164 RepID=UPI0011C99BFE|nr:6-hydroxymethylpterin diphosphokinase MptE-like protein [Treponema pectinovorum]